MRETAQQLDKQYLLIKTLWQIQETPSLLIKTINTDSAIIFYNVAHKYLQITIKFPSFIILIQVCKMNNERENTMPPELQVIPKEIDRTNIRHQSMIITSPNKDSLNENNSVENQFNRKAETLSQNILVNTFKKDKVPSILKMTLSQSKNQKRQQPKQSRLRSILKSKINELKNIKKCQICQTPFKKSNKQPYMCDCQHKFNFCESCLHHYVIYKVKTFEEVHCPRDQCSALMDSNAEFFKQLPIDIQQKYIKLHKFYANANNANIKLCPKQNCQGLIRMAPDNFMLCDICNGQFCIKCLLTKHVGDCDTHQLQFFQGNLHYRQCKKCKFIIEKDQGCNHMTCRCGFQFCYVCGADWQQAHYGNHDSSGQLIVEVGNGVNNAPQYNEDQCCECDCDCCSCECCDCCQQFCNSPFGCIVKAPLKLLLFILFTLLLIFIILFKDIIVTIVMILVSILAGMFGFSFGILFDLDGALFVLGIIFFPITMLAGIGMGFRQLFCQVMSMMWGDTCEMITDGFSNICQI